MTLYEEFEKAFPSVEADPDYDFWENGVTEALCLRHCLDKELVREAIEKHKWNPDNCLEEGCSGCVLEIDDLKKELGL